MHKSSYQSILFSSFWSSSWYCFVFSSIASCLCCSKSHAFAVCPAPFANIIHTWDTSHCVIAVASGTCCVKHQCCNCWRGFATAIIGRKGGNILTGGLAASLFIFSLFSLLLGWWCRLSTFLWTTKLASCCLLCLPLLYTWGLTRLLVRSDFIGSLSSKQFLGGCSIIVDPSSKKIPVLGVYQYVPCTVCIRRPHKASQVRWWKSLFKQTYGN